MKHMRMALLGVFVVLAFGCGGGGANLGSGGGGGGGSSPYAGSWSGTFQDQIPVNGSGPITMAIEGSGKFTATGHNNRTGTDFTGSGTVSGSGNVVGTLKIGSTDATVTGQLFLRAGPKIEGTVYASANGKTQQLNLELQK
jgi:hypothetical protein